MGDDENTRTGHIIQLRATAKILIIVDPKKSMKF